MSRGGDDCAAQVRRIASMVASYGGEAQASTRIAMRFDTMRRSYGLSARRASCECGDKGVRARMTVAHLALYAARGPDEERQIRRRHRRSGLPALAAQHPARV